MTGFAIVSTTVGSADDASHLARALVDARLAACVQIVPVRSVYRWDGAVEEASEHLLLCKIAADAFAAVEEAIRARHSYDVPEIVMTRIEAGSPPYLAWMAERRPERKRRSTSRKVAAAMPSSSAGARLELDRDIGRIVARHFHADADLFDDRGNPGHVSLRTRFMGLAALALCRTFSRRTNEEIRSSRSSASMIKSFLSNPLTSL